MGAIERLSANSDKERNGSIRPPELPPVAEYEDRVVAFIDVLGFQEVIQKSATDLELVQSIHRALSVNYDGLAEIFAGAVDLDLPAGGFGDRISSFSDCVVVSVRPNVREVCFLVFIVFSICRRLLIAGLLTRGGIARGSLFHQAMSAATATPGTVFGPALVKAYHLESSYADGPRVILENATREYIQGICENSPPSQLTEFLLTYIKRAEDGPAYIDPFADIGPCEHSDMSIATRADLGVIHKHLCNALNRSSDKPSHFRKNAQLARLFNNALSRAGRPDLHIGGDLLPGRQT